MLISNFNVCKSEWLELVFVDRNKEYGAYDLRQHYSKNITKAMAFAFFGIITTTAIVGFAIRTKPITDRIIDVNTNTIYTIPPAPKPIQPKQQIEKVKPTAAKPAAAVSVTKDLPPVVAPDPIAVDPPKIDQLNGAVGPVDIKGPATGTDIGTGTGKGTATDGPGTADAPDNKEYKFVENMPTPMGGDAAWSKFLQKNLRYPGDAADNGVTGRVLVSFIVEKDGHLSNIKVERGPGYGMDEEAARVLKLAKPWNPGKQNGQAVRVKLLLPIAFSLGD
ncbi:TonB family protein [Mucilaginibacter corticis]|uniref:TonB family protein n=1 Tax=Mucilaginibacter corticis TaxID=2597670 RepID=A0A556MBK5_9SPHI|nr:energy transducer TonB [Mucilaginibacter corticis]TSJ37252.1 TonB family protein [Mucilaginibacter corticis]